MTIEEEYLGTIKRAKENDVSYIWSGDLLRNEYLRNCLAYGGSNNLLSLTYVEMEQETGYNVRWLF